MKLTDVLTDEGLMRHRVKVSEVRDRRPWLAEKCKGRSVLHVGCCDVPIFDPNHNLHIELSGVTERLDGLDISDAGIDVLKKHVYGDYFTSVSDVSTDYQLVLVPEVLEHTTNPGAFLQQIFSVPAERYLITAPDFRWYAQMTREGDTFVEDVHGDHRAWYSPYTLLNAVRPHVCEDEDEVEVFLIDGVGSVGVEIVKPVMRGRWNREFPPGATAGDSDAQLWDAAVRLHGQERSAEALFVLERISAADVMPRAYYLRSQILLEKNRQMDCFRLAVDFMKMHPKDRRCLTFAADAAEGLGQREQAAQLRRMATHLEL